MIIATTDSIALKKYQTYLGDNAIFIRILWMFRVVKWSELWMFELRQFYIFWCGITARKFLGAEKIGCGIAARCKIFKMAAIFSLKTVFLVENFENLFLQILNLVPWYCILQTIPLKLKSIFQAEKVIFIKNNCYHWILRLKIDLNTYFKQDLTNFHFLVF